MIVIKNIYNSAVNIVISQLPIKENPHAVVEAINLGLIDLFTMFNLGTGSETIEVSKDVYNYKLRNQNIMQVIEVISNGKSLKNIDDYEMLDYNLIALKKPFNGVIKIIYKSAPPYVELKDSEKLVFEPATVNMPVAFSSALLDYIAYRSHITIVNGVEGLQEIDIHYKHYLSACNRLKSQGYGNDKYVEWGAYGLR